MQVLVVYHSVTGNTGALAHAVARGIDGVAGVTGLVKSATEVTNDDFLASEGVIAGSPVYFGTMAAELKAVFDGLEPIRNQLGDKVGAAFTTSGDLSGGKETTMLSILQAMLICGMIVVGDPLDATGHYGTSCVGAPDNKSEANAELLGRRVGQLVQKLGG